MATQESKKPRRKPGKLDIDALLTRVLNLLAHHPPSKLTFSQVSRLTGVPRPTLYYYFGNSPKTMLDEAVRFGMKSLVRFYQLEKNPSEPDWASFQRARLLDVVRLIRKHPWAPALYFRYRNNVGEFGETVRDIEEKYVLKMCEMWKRYHGTAPDARSVRLASYLKLGFLWGITLDQEIWLGSEASTDESLIGPLVEHFTVAVTRMMGMRLPK